MITTQTTAVATFTAPTEELIKEVVALALDVDVEDLEFDMTKNFYEDLNMDSLGAITMVIETQKAFGVRLLDERVPHIRTGDQLMAAVLELQQTAEVGAGASA
jgi:acyl carrier protein